MSQCDKCQDKGRILYKGELLWCDCMLGLALLFAELPAPSCPNCEDGGRQGVTFEERIRGPICDCGEGRKVARRLWRVK